MRATPRLVTSAGAALLLALGGCATAPGPGGPASTGRTPDPAELSQWVAKGRIALSAPGSGGSGSFVWQQRSERTELAVRGPFGAGALNIVTDGETLQVVDSSGATIDGEAARRELEQRLGTDLPLPQLRYWMLGLPAPIGGAPDQADPEVRSFTQAGWEVSFDGFLPTAGWSLPTKLTATAPAARVRIIVDDWQVPVP